MTQPTTTIIYLTGKPGVGKYTIAKELAANHGFIVCDNQLINNPIFELLQYDGYAKEKADLHPTYVGSVERGERNIALENIIAIAKALGCSPKDLMPD